MGSKLSITISKYWNDGSDLELTVRGAIISEKPAGQQQIILLKVTRKSDKHTTRLNMFAYLRNNKPGYQSLGFPQVTLIFDQYTADGKFVSRTLTDFFDVAVQSLYALNDQEEEVTFIAASKSADLAISNVVRVP